MAWNVYCDIKNFGRVFYCQIACELKEEALKGVVGDEGIGLRVCFGSLHSHQLFYKVVLI